MFWKKIKSFYNKDNIDFSTGYIDPFSFHKTFYKMMVTFKVADLNNKYPPSYFKQNAILFSTILSASLLILVALCHGVETFDFALVTESATYTFVLSYGLLILSATRQNLKQFHNLLKSFKEDFEFICSTGEKYRARFFENQVKTWKICVLTYMFCTVTPLGMVLFSFLSLFYFLATFDVDVGGNRPLLFPFWLPDVDFGKSPVYELTFLYANICVLLYSYLYTFMIQTQIVWIRQIASKVDFVIWGIQDLLVDIHPATSKEDSKYFSYLIKTRMSDIIQHHQSMYSLIDDYSIVYKRFLLYEQMVCGPVICLTAYCTAEKLDEGEFQAILLMLCVATIAFYFVPNFLCDFLAKKVHSVCETCWSIPFWNAGRVLRPYIVLVMQRSQRPLPLTTPGFNDISIETFSQKIANAYTLFNMLRQTNL